jgi:DNA-directed RNA polymerase alpha subunit
MSESESNNYFEGLTRLVDEHRLLSQQHKALTEEITLLKKSMEEMLAHAQAIIDLNSDIEISKPKKLAPIFKQGIEWLDFSIRVYNCLRNHSILTVEDLVQKRETEILQSKSFGRRGLNEIKEVLQTNGLQLGMNKEDMLAWPSS